MGCIKKSPKNLAWQKLNDMDYRSGHAIQSNDDYYKIICQDEKNMEKIKKY